MKVYRATAERNRCTTQELRVKSPDWLFYQINSCENVNFVTMSGRKLLLILALSLFTTVAFGQFKVVMFGVDGLTCSACSRSVEMQIRKLDFVDNVEMDLANTSGEIYFKDSSKIKIDKIAKAITDAGFSVRSLSAVFNFDKVDIGENFCWEYAGAQFQFLKTQNRQLNGDVLIKFIGEKYLSKKELKKWSLILKKAMSTGCVSKNTYYVTL